MARYPTAIVALALIAVMACDHMCQARKSSSYIIKGAGCSAHEASQPCRADSRCSWCTSSVKGAGGCFPTAAKLLLPATLTCTAEDDPCGNKSEGDCIGPTCVWCTSAAVGGGCYTPDEAKLLPSAIFKCKTSPTSSAFGSSKAAGDSQEA